MRDLKYFTRNKLLCNMQIFKSYALLVIPVFSYFTPTLNCHYKVALIRWENLDFLKNK